MDIAVLDNNRVSIHRIVYIFLPGFRAKRLNRERKAVSAQRSGRNRKE